MQITDKATLQQFLENANNVSLFNTSYPIRPEHWFKYKQSNIDLFEHENKLCIYIHIPFCERLCSFCEYTRYKKDSNKESKYMDILEHDIDAFIAKHKGKQLIGLDIGGGTPTALDDGNFARLMDIVRKIKVSFDIPKTMICSIEGTFETLTPFKIQQLSKEFKRVSIGVQSTNVKILFENNKIPVDINKMQSVVDQLRKFGVKILNLDFMYGLDGQSIEDIQDSFKVINTLKPEHFTVYETRYNMTNPNHHVNRDKNKEQYDIFYDMACTSHYDASYGRNTFSQIPDLGLSDYLYHRTVNNTPYKGFGISAQSKSNSGLSYNIGKREITDLDTLLSTFKSFESTFAYILPKEELLAKYVAICGYLGFIDCNICEEIYPHFERKYRGVLTLLRNCQYIFLSPSHIRITDSGFQYYAGILALFYPSYVTSEFDIKM